MSYDVRIPLSWIDARIVAETRRLIRDARQLIAETDHLTRPPYRKPGEMRSRLSERERICSERKSSTSSRD